MNKNEVIYSVLKELEKGVRPNQNDYSLTLEHFGEIVEEMFERKLIRNANVIRSGSGHTVQYILLNGAVVTLDGHDFWEKNSALSKTYRAIKEIRDWLK